MSYHIISAEVSFRYVGSLVPSYMASYFKRH